MKHPVTILSVLFWAWIIGSMLFFVIMIKNLYPFGYPVKPGEVYELTWKFQEGTPVEKVQIDTVVVDSTYQGYVISAHKLNSNQPYTDGTTMRRFLGTGGYLGPTSYKRLK